MGITNKLLEARIAAGHGAESTSRKIFERISAYDDSAASYEQMIKDFNQGIISAYDAEGNCFFCRRGDYHWLFSTDEQSFGAKRKCAGKQEEGFICVDDQRARGVLELKRALEAHTAAQPSAPASPAPQAPAHTEGPSESTGEEPEPTQDSAECRAEDSAEESAEDAARRRRDDKEGGSTAAPGGVAGF